MKPTTFVLTLTAATLLASPASPQEASKTSDSTERFKALQEQRIEVLKLTTEIGLKLYQRGALEGGAVLEDRLALLKAEVEAAPAAERVRPHPNRRSARRALPPHRATATSAWNARLG